VPQLCAGFSVAAYLAFSNTLFSIGVTSAVNGECVI
jgi:hypothetical protein